MAIKGLTKLDRLLTTLNSANIREKDPAGYQVIAELIKAVRDLVKETDNNINNLPVPPFDISDEDFITSTDETGVLPNSRRLVAGAGITLDLSVPGQEIIESNVGDSDLLTWSDESSTLPNSRELVAGTNITFSDAVPNQRIINASGGGSGPDVTLVGEGSYLQLDVPSQVLTKSLIDLATDTVGTFGPDQIAHDFLSDVHPDTVPASPVLGDLVVAQSTDIIGYGGVINSDIEEDFDGIRTAYFTGIPGGNNVPLSGPIPQYFGNNLSFESIPTLPAVFRRPFNWTIVSHATEDFKGIRPTYTGPSDIPVSGPFLAISGIDLPFVTPDPGGLSLNPKWVRFPIGNEGQILVVEEDLGPQWIDGPVYPLSVENGGTGGIFPSQAFDNLSPLNEDGDLLTYNGGNTRLPITPNRLLSSNSGSPEWDVELPLEITDGGTGENNAPDAFNALSPMTTSGDLITHDGTEAVRLPRGAGGNLLSVNAGQLQWFPPSGLGLISGPGISVDNEIVLFNGTTGGVIKRATGNGFVKAASGVYSTATQVNLATEVTGILPDINLSANVPLTTVGTWTPTIGGTGGESGQVYSVQQGYYIKIGRLVHVSCRVQLSTLGTITNLVQIKGFPFPSTVNSNYRSTVSVIWANLAVAIFNCFGGLNENSTAFTILAIAAASTSGNASFLTQANLTNTTQFAFSLVYMTD